MTDDRGQRTGDGGQRADDRRQMTEGGGDRKEERGKREAVRV